MRGKMQSGFCQDRGTWASPMLSMCLWSDEAGGRSCRCRGGSEGEAPLVTHPDPSSDHHLHFLQAFTLL